MLLRIAVATLLAFGLYHLIGIPFKFPSRASVKAISKLTEKKMPLKERICYPIARLIEPLVHLSPYQKNQLERKLKAAGKKTTPEFHTALAISVSLIYLIVGLIVLPVLPLGTAALTVYAVLRFFKEQKVKDGDNHREKVEAETPRFTSYIVQSLSHRQDLSGIIRGYREIAGKDLGSELDTLLTDMRTKNREAALIDFESRIDSPLVSELVRGLIGIEHGEDMQAYLTNVGARMNEHEIAALKKEAVKRPDKLMPASWLLFASIMLIYAAVMGVQLYSSLKSL